MEGPVDPALLSYLSSRVASLEQESFEIRGELADYHEEQIALERKTSPAPGDGDCDACVDIADQYCNRAQMSPEPNPCKDGSCEIPLQPTDNVCYRIYKNKGCYSSALTAALRAKVDSCWRVARDRELILLSVKATELRDIEADEERDIQKLLSAAGFRESCPAGAGVSAAQ